MKQIEINFNKKIVDFSKKLQKELNSLLANQSYSSNKQLLEAIGYSLFSGGKNLRPFLVFAIANMYNNHMPCIIRVSAVIEMIHCYSLIHDDLPAMDNDDYRRGKLSCHKKYDEATAILAGDSLLTFAFELLADPLTYENAEVRCKIISLLARSVGFNGMAGGQGLDIAFEDKEIEESDIIRMQQMKTAYLFAASAEIGAILSGATISECKVIKDYGLNLGLAFQIIDDVLDVIGNERELGKAINKDADLGKATLVKKFGINYSSNLASEFILKAKNNILTLNNNYEIDDLISLADFVVNRKY